MKPFERLSVLNNFTPYLFFTNVVEWDKVIPLYFNVTGDTENIYLQFFDKRGAAINPSNENIFTIKEFQKFWSKDANIEKNTFSDLVLYLFKKTPDGKMTKINANELGDLIIELGYELQNTKTAEISPGGLLLEL